VIGTTGTASTVASNQYPGGFGLGNFFGVAAGTNSTNGGGQIVNVIPRAFATTDFQSFSATSGTITHDNAAVVLLSVSTTGSSYNIQPPSYHGQVVSIALINQSCSIATGVTTTGFGGTTTAACQVLDSAATLPAGQGAAFIGLAQRGGTATTNLPVVWHRLC